MTIDNVIKNGYCVGCGGCKLFSSDSVNINFDENGFYNAKIKQPAPNDLSKVCPFSDESINEDVLGKKLYETEAANFDQRVGYYNEIFTGNVIDKESRINSSSGGLTSWLSEKLLDEGHVDAVVHVGSSENAFSYRVSKSVEEIRNERNKKSRYSPVTLASVESYLNTTNDRVLIIGIPCYIKSIRLLQQLGRLKNVRYCISLLCGHMKSSGFGEFLAWQLGVEPQNIDYLDFRVKKEGYNASEYFFSVRDRAGNVKEQLNASLLGSNWGLGFFRHKSCNFCDDIAGETADVTLGDAWLPEYTKEYLGTNIVVVRNETISNLFSKYGYELEINKVDVDTFYQTQRGNYGNRRGGIIAQVNNRTEWQPKKRIELCLPYKGGCDKQKLYISRSKLSKISIKYFKVAKKYNSIVVFKILILPHLVVYNYKCGGIKSMIATLIPKKIKQIIKRF